MIPVIDRLSALADQTRCRLLLALERQELTVGELRSALQLPQSTVSRHLKVLADQGWVASRSEGVSNWYRTSRHLDDETRRLWGAVREPLAKSAAAGRDADRISRIVAARHRRTRDFFATGAAQWDRVRAELFGEGLEWMVLGGLLDPEAAVADLGAGTAPLSAALAPFVRQVVAVDESAAMLEAAASRTRVFGNVDCRQGTLEALPIDSGSIDLAFAVLVLHHLPEPALAVAEAARILRPGGRLVIVDMLPHDRVEYRETMGHQWLGFSAATVAEWCERTGLSKPACRALVPAGDTKGPSLFVGTAGKLHQGEDIR